MPDAHPSSELSGVFGRPFAEQVAFFRRKLGNLVPTQRWDDLVREAHDTGFMVAGATKADLLTDLAAAVDKAIAEGGGIEAFRKDFRAIVARNGWTGWTGEGSVKGEAWRTGVIYRTNMYTSYSAGRFAQLEQGGFPLWVYRHGNSKEPRPQHLAWNGLVLPPDHPFWKTHYPPSDWGCSCYALGARSDAGAARLGGDPGKTLPAGWDRIDPKTGAPVGIGKNWDYAPGASASAEVQALAAKIDTWGEQVASAFMDELPATSANALSRAYRSLPTTADDVRRIAQRVAAGTVDGVPDVAPLPEARTLGLVRSDQAARIAELTGVDTSRLEFALEPRALGGDGIGGTGASPAELARLPAMLDSPDAIESAGTGAGGQRRIVYVWRVAGELWRATFDLRDAALALAGLTIDRAAG